MDLHRHFHR